MRQAIAIMCFIGLPLVEHAASRCVFTTECYETEACEETVFEMEFRAGTGDPNGFELVTDAELIGVSIGGTSGVAHIAGMTEAGFHVLTLRKDSGAARYNNHISDGPQTVTYHGICKVGP